MEDQGKGTTEKNITGFLMFVASLLLVALAGGVIIRTTCLPPLADDPIYQKARQRFIDKPLVELNPQALLVRAGEMRDFLDDYPNDLDAAKIAKAIELSEIFSTSRRYNLKVKRIGVFKEARSFEFRIIIGSNKFKVRTDHKKKVIYPDQKLSFDWQIGTPIQLELEEFEWLNDLVFEKSTNKGVTLEILSGLQKFKPNSATAEYLHNNMLEIDFHLDEVSADDLQVFSDYVYPGDMW